MDLQDFWGLAAAGQADIRHPCQGKGTRPQERCFLSQLAAENPFLVNENNWCFQAASSDLHLTWGEMEHPLEVLVFLRKGQWPTRLAADCRDL